MARSDLLVNLIKAAVTSDQRLVKKTVEALVTEERSKQHHILAKKMEEIMHSSYSNTPLTPTASHIDEKIHSLVHEVTPRKGLTDIVLSDDVYNACTELIEEQHRCDLLRSYNLEPRNRVLLSGPPGNGKTSLAEALAGELYLPLFIVRYDGIIGSYLGETAQRLNRLFDYVRKRRCVLFFDEFDAIGKERGDTHETGEIKRVVSSLLLQVDELPSYVIVVAATNHPELLDKAVWRRFQLRLNLPLPTKKQVEQWFIRFEKSVDQPLGYTPSELADNLYGLSYAELQDFCADILRRYVLSLPASKTSQIVQERLEQWKHRYSLLDRKRRGD